MMRAFRSAPDSVDGFHVRFRVTGVGRQYVEAHVSVLWSQGARVGPGVQVPLQSVLRGVDVLEMQIHLQSSSEV